MRESSLRSIIGLLVIVGHFAILLLVFVFYVNGGFLFEEMTTAVGLIAPMFATYSTVILRQIVKMRTAAPSGTTVTAMFSFVSLFIPIIFVCAIAAIVALKATNVGFGNFEEFKTTLVIAESLFGVYVGMFIKALYTD